MPFYVGGSAGMRNMGTYAAGTTYFPNDLVQYNGSSYIAIATTTGNLPTNATYWGVLASGSSGGSGGGLTPTVQSGPATYNASAGQLVLANASGGAFTVTLPTPTAAGAMVGVKKTDISGFGVTVVATTVGGVTPTIDGDSSALLSSEDVAATFVYDGTNWQIQSTAITNSSAIAGGIYDPYAPAFTPQMVYSRRSLSMAPLTSLFSSTMTTNGLIYCAVYLWKAVNFDTLYYQIGSTAPTAGATLRIGLYTNNSSNQPGTLITEFSPSATPFTLSGTASTIQSYSVTGTLPKGWSWVAHSFGGSAPGAAYCVPSNAGVTPGGGIPLTSMVAGQANASSGVTYYQQALGVSTNPALKASAGAMSPTTETYLTANHCGPEFYFKVA